MKLIHNILSLSGKPWAVQAAGQPFVYFEYNLAGDNTKVYSSVANDWERNYTYDWLGRRLTYTEGELSESYTYNGSNLATHTQSWLENGNPHTKAIHYHYTAHRLDSVGYDDALSTIYHYDQYGRVDSLYDESGVVCYTYGNMGEVTQETRIYALPFLSSPLALSMQFTYDSWGRIQDITYPDNEVVSYTYDLGGQLQSITNNSSYTYLDNVSYDRFGAKVHQEYGNGMETDYDYNIVRRLSRTGVSCLANGLYSDISYLYDPVGNVSQMTSSYVWTQGQGLTENITYDASDQLVSAAETQAQSYQLAVTYGNWGKISGYSLAQTDLQNNTTQSEAQAYTYPATNSIGNSQTRFAPQQRTITDANNNVSIETLTFGINGSLRKREVQGVVPHTEHYLFNSAANMKAYSNNGLDFAYYGYNASNARTYKLCLSGTIQWQNGQQLQMNLQPHLTQFYPNAYINFNGNGEYTKHYYNGSERIASRLGDMTAYIYAEAGERLENRIMRLDALFRSQIGELVSYEEPEQPAILGNRNGGTRELVSPPVEYEPFLSIPSLQPTGSPDDIFYYHMNHLGSTAYVTDQNQNITQGFLYAPFGEITTEYAPLWQNGTLPKYAFNAKELDEETGMYYYEARYYKPPVFTSRDPMFEKYFWMSPYAYCANNPVKYVDPDGNNPILPQYIYFAVAKVMEHCGNSSKVRQLGYSMQNPINAIRVGEYKPGKNNISTIASNFQVNVANAVGLSTGNEGDQGNAFRHVLWQAIITKEMGVEQALRIGNAHEDNLNIDLNQRTFKDMTDADKAVDLLNNRIGRKIGDNNKEVSNQTMAKLVAKEFYENGLWTTSQNKDGSVSIKKTKITKEQYDAAIAEINKKGNNGLNQ